MTAETWVTDVMELRRKHHLSAIKIVINTYYVENLLSGNIKLVDIGLHKYPLLFFPYKPSVYNLYTPILFTK